MNVRLAAVLLASSLLPASNAVSKPKGDEHTLKEIEAQLKTLSKGKDAAPHLQAFGTWLGIASKCEAGDCKKVLSTHWIAANLDDDEGDEKVLAIATSGEGKCPSATLDVIVFRATPKGLVAIDHRRTRLAEAASPKLDVSAAKVHDPKRDDLVIRVDGQCPGGAREHRVTIDTLRDGALHTIASSSDWVGDTLQLHALVGSAPVAIELVHDKGKTKLLWDEASGAYDPLPPYQTAMKSSTQKDDDETLSTTECAAPLGGVVATECGLTGSAKVQVAVQNGKAVGLTVSTEPAKPRVVRCLRKAIASASWKSVSGTTGCVRTFTLK